MLIPPRDSARDLDAICVGRVGLDLYARELDTDFAEVTGFDKHVGGSPGLIAIGLAKLGARSAVLSRVSDDMIGRYVISYLDGYGVDTSGIRLDASGTRTSLAITEMRAEHCGVVIYRNDAADLALSVDDIDESQIARTRLLVVSGTALSRDPSRSATMHAISLARRHGASVVLDLDYRAYTWQSLAEAGDVYADAARHASILVGNREEFAVLGIPESASGAAVAEACLGSTTGLVLVKAGGAGSEVFTRDGQAFAQAVFEVDVTKPFGAGDAYAAATLASLAEGRALEESVRRGAAAAAIVVAAASCAEASPNAEELDRFLAARV